MRASVFIDGGYTRVVTGKAGFKYSPDYIEKLALACVGREESILRILYYDCRPYNGTQKLPVSGTDHVFDGSAKWLADLAQRDLFAVRLGTLKFRGWEPKSIPVSPETLKDDDFKPRFEQKGVDMRIGLDIALHADNRLVDRIVLVTADTDCVPAMKHARKSGLQVIIPRLGSQRLAPEIVEHADFVRNVALPAGLPARVSDLP